MLEREIQFGLTEVETYTSFQSRADKVKNDFLAFLLDQKQAGRKVAAYGAAAKGNTLLNYAGIRPDLLPYVCDAASSKQGKLMPGSHVPIRPPQALRENPPDDIIVLPWNIADEVRGTLADLTASGTRLVCAIPELRFL
jgi:hypothetical protein